MLLHNTADTIDSPHRQKERLGGDVSKLLWLYFFMVPMVIVFALQAKLVDICENYFVSRMNVAHSKEIFGPDQGICRTVLPILLIGYSLIYANHSSMLPQEFVLIRYKDDRTKFHDKRSSESESPTSIKCSFYSIMMSYVMINLYLTGVEVGLFVWKMNLTASGRDIPVIFDNPLFYSFAYYGLLSLYTFQIFDVWTNIMLIICTIEMIFYTDDYFQGALSVAVTVQYNGLCLHSNKSEVAAHPSSSEHRSSTGTSASQSQSSGGLDGGVYVKVATHFVNTTSKIDLILNPLPYSTLIEP
jgi:hypothetical protein